MIGGTTCRMAGFLGPGMLRIINKSFFAHDRTLPHHRLQARRTARFVRQEAVHPAFHAIAGSELC